MSASRRTLPPSSRRRTMAGHSARCCSGATSSPHSSTRRRAARSGCACWTTSRGSRPMAFEIFPAIDLRAGQCVRLLQGDYARETVFSDDPVGIAQRWADAGARWLHIVDLDGARTGISENLPVVRQIAAAVPLPIQLGGGMRDRTAIRAALDAGVRRVILG